MNKGQLQTGVEALHFLETIPLAIWRVIDTVIWDSPYFDSDNKNDMERVNQRSRMNGSSKIIWNDSNTRLMNSKEREAIISYIRRRINDSCYIAHFHTDPSRVVMEKEKACEHIWVKPIHYCIAGNADRNNGESIIIEGTKIKGKPKGQILNKYINAVFSREKHLDDFIPDGHHHIPRACAKPFRIYSEIYRHLDSKVILDPFAGYGMSIKAGLSRGAVVYACDLDPTLEWDFDDVWVDITTQETLEGVFT